MHTTITLSLLLVVVTAAFVASAPNQTPEQQKRKLERTTGKRWDRLNEVVRALIASETQKFMMEKGQSLHIPIHVDILTLGMEGDGAYHYKMNTNLLVELLAQHEEVCPTVWETEQKARICFSVTYNVLSTPQQGLQALEMELRKAMTQMSPSAQERPSDILSRQAVPVYNLEASGAIEDKIASIVDQAYYEEDIPLPGENPRSLSKHRLSIVLLNPSKLRMSPLFSTVQEGILAADKHTDFMQEWTQGHLSQDDLIAQEAGYMYRYMYNGRGGTGVWVSSRNFVVVDLSAGPCDFGPLATPDGHLTPIQLPRLTPLLMHMAEDIQKNPQIGTLHAHLLEEAMKGQHSMQRGALAELIVSATHHIFCPDIKMGLIEHPAQYWVQLIVVHDDDDYDATLPDPGTDAEFKYGLDTVPVQAALDVLVDSKSFAYCEVSQVKLHHHRKVAAALHRAKMSVSSTFIGGIPGQGLLRSRQVHLDADVLTRELLMATPLLADVLMPWMIDSEEREKLVEDDLATHAKHEGTRIVPVFILSLTSGPDQLLLDHQQFASANREAAIVLQMRPEDGNFTAVNENGAGYVHTKHMLNGQYVKIHGSTGVTQNVIAGLATSVAGVVPPFERYDHNVKAVVSDWRWSQGAMPWGPYANSSKLSTIFAATARRNVFISHLETSIHMIQKRLDEVDAFVGKNLQGPFGFLHEELETLHGRRHGRHWLNALANRSHGYNETIPPDVVERLERMLKEVTEQLETVIYNVYRHDYTSAETELPALFAAVDFFSKHVKHDLELAADTMACCVLHHKADIVDGLFVAITMVVLSGAMALFAVVFVFFTGRAGRRNRRLVLPGIHLARAPSGSRRSQGGGIRVPWSPTASSGGTTGGAAKNKLETSHSWKEAQTATLAPASNKLNV